VGYSDLSGDRLKKIRRTGIYACPENKTNIIIATLTVSLKRLDSV
jgi:hypothetical protein